MWEALEAAGIDNPLRRLPELDAMELLLLGAYRQTPRRYSEMGGQLLPLSLAEVRDALWAIGIEDREMVSEAWRAWAALDRKVIELREEAAKAKAEAAEQEKKNARNANAYA